VTFTLERRVGASITEVLNDLADLRVAVFREFPYLYEGTPEYERRYLHTYVQSSRSLAVIVRHGAKAVGATTALPLADETPEFQRPFREAGVDVGSVFYLAESVLLPPYRGRGLGVRFFEERERHARRLGSFTTAAFCAVERPADHPLRPRSYEPLDAFWRKRGYEKQPELHTEFVWRDVNEQEDTPKRMVFWLKTITPESPTEPQETA